MRLSVRTLKASRKGSSRFQPKPFRQLFLVVVLASRRRAFSQSAVHLIEEDARSSSGEFWSSSHKVTASVVGRHVNDVQDRVRLLLLLRLLRRLSSQQHRLGLWHRSDGMAVPLTASTRSPAKGSHVPWQRRGKPTRGCDRGWHPTRRQDATSTSTAAPPPVWKRVGGACCCLSLGGACSDGAGSQVVSSTVGPGATRTSCAAYGEHPLTGAQTASMVVVVLLQRRLFDGPIKCAWFEDDRGRVSDGKAPNTLTVRILKHLRGALEPLIILSPSPSTSPAAERHHCLAWTAAQSMRK